MLSGAPADAGAVAAPAAAEKKAVFPGSRQPFPAGPGSSASPAPANANTGANTGVSAGQKMMAQNAVSSSRMLAPMVIMKPAARVLGSFTYARA